MYDRFNELGIPVYLTRDSDVTLNPNDRINEILSFLGNNPNVVVISNHLNAGGGDGAEVIYALRNSSYLADLILNNIGNTGQNTRRVYQRRLPSNPTKDYYYILRDTGLTEPVIVEYGFIDNEDDLSFLKNNYRELAEAVIKSVLEYKDIPYIGPDVVVSDTYKVIVCKDGQQAIDELSSISNSIVGMLLDINMPNVDGYEVLKFMKTNNLFNRINVAIISGNDSNQILDATKEYPIKAILEKPFNEENIKRIVDIISKK